MIDGILTLYHVEAKKKIAVKTAVAAAVVVLAVILPQIVHLTYGQSGGVVWLPMYLPVLLGGCVLGSKWAVMTGIASPLVSFIITSALGSPMPAFERLPFMMVELAVFALVSGLFSKKIFEKTYYVFPAIILAQLAGRLSFLILAFIFQSFVSFTPAMIASQIAKGVPGIIAQIIIVSALTVLIKKIMIKEQKEQ